MKECSDIRSNCPICYYGLNDAGLKCGHLFCLDCLCSYLTLNILEGEVFGLLCPNCTYQISRDEIKLLTSAETYEKYKSFFSIKILLKNKEVRLCPKPDCQGFDLRSSTNFNLTCKICRTGFCSECSQSWHKGPCKKFDDPKFAMWGIKENMKTCPRCRSFVIKAGGCKTIKCLKCDLLWCWGCSKDIDENHNILSCFMKRRVLDYSWKMILVFLFFPVCFFYLFFYMICVQIRDYYAPCQCCYNYKCFNKIVAFIVSPIMGFIFFPIGIDCGLIYYLYDHGSLLKKKIGVFAFYMILGVLFAIFLPACFALFVAFAVLGSVFFPVLGLILTIFKLKVRFRRY